MRRICAILFVSLAFWGCRKEPKPIIGVVPKGASHIFWQTVHAGAVKAAMEFGYEIEWNSPTLENDTSRQMAILESMINRRLAGISVAPIDSKALVNVIERAGKAGVPVAVFDSDIETQNRVTYVATNNVEGGRVAARRLGELMRGEGKCAIIGFVAGSASTMERDRGFQEELKAKFPKIRIVQLTYANGNRAEAKTQTENILTAHPDLGGIFADNESSSAGAALALRARATTQVRVVGFDASQQLIEELKDRFIDALIIQDPMKMGYESVRALAMHRKGEQPPRVIDSGLYVADRSNLEDPDMIRLLYPDVKRYLEAATR